MLCIHQIYIDLFYTTTAMVATVGDPADTVIIHTSKVRGAELTSSYEEEKAALPLALGWARANPYLKQFRVAYMTPSLFISD